MKRLLLFFFCSFFLVMNVQASSNSARSYVLMDINSGRILASKNMNEKLLIASTTKIMTCLIVLENANLDDVITVGDEVLSMYGTNIYIKEGEKLTVEDLLYGLMLRSGNDAAITLAVHTLGEDAFIEKMNEKAIEIGMKNTAFFNPHGLDDSTKNYSTAKDMAILGRYAYQNETYRRIISTKKYVTKSSLKSYVWYNRMSLLTQYKNCIGGKNGYTPKAGKTLVSYSVKDDITLMLVTLDDSNLYDNHKKMYEKYFSLYQNYLIVDDKNFRLESTFTEGDLYLKESFSYPLLKEEINSITTLIEFYPVTKDGKSGRIIIKLKEEEIGSVDIYQRKTKKEEISFFQKIKKLFIR